MLRLAFEPGIEGVQELALAVREPVERFVRQLAEQRLVCSEIRILLRTTTVTLPAEAAPAIRALRAAPQSAGALPGLDAGSSLVVSRRLLREGVVVLR